MSGQLVDLHFVNFIGKVLAVFHELLEALTNTYFYLMVYYSGQFFYLWLQLSAIAGSQIIQLGFTDQCCQSEGSLRKFLNILSFPVSNFDD